jgi:hypothetical protein
MKDAITELEIRGAYRRIVSTMRGLELHHARGYNGKWKLSMPRRTPNVTVTATSGSRP